MSTLDTKQKITSCSVNDKMLWNLKFLGRAFNLLWNGFFNYHILQEVDITTLNKFWPISLNLIIVKCTSHEILGRSSFEKLCFAVIYFRRYYQIAFFSITGCLAEKFCWIQSFKGWFYLIFAIFQDFSPKFSEFFRVHICAYYKTKFLHHHLPVA